MSGFVPFVVPSAHGPHVTLTAGVEAFGRFWTTTSRSAYKTRAVRCDGVAGYTVTEGSRTIASTGTAVVVDPLRPWSARRDLGAASVAPMAVARIGLSNLRQVLGYLETFGDVVPGWSFADRVVLAVAPRHEMIVDRAEAAVVTQWGRLTARSLAALEAVDPSALPDGVLDLLVSALAGSSPCVAGLAAPGGQVAIPAVWRGDGLALPTKVGDDVARDGGWAAMFDESGSRRPGDKFGCFVRGTAADGELTATRLTWWDGFRSGTIRLDDGRTVDGRAA